MIFLLSDAVGKAVYETQPGTHSLSIDTESHVYTTFVMSDQMKETMSLDWNEYLMYHQDIQRRYLLHNMSKCGVYWHAFVYTIGNLKRHPVMLGKRDINKNIGIGGVTSRSNKVQCIKIIECSKEEQIIPKALSVSSYHLLS